MALNDVDGAVESFGRALELEPNDGNVIWNRYIGDKLVLLA